MVQWGRWKSTLAYIIGGWHFCGASKIIGGVANSGGNAKIQD
jgi:hypothetical protein